MYANGSISTEKLSSRVSIGIQHCHIGMSYTVGKLSNSTFQRNGWLRGMQMRICVIAPSLGLRTYIPF